MAWFLIALALVSMLLLVLALNPWGVGVVYDSVFYLSGADNLSAGRGLVWNAGGDELRPLVHFPPGYSAFLAVLGSASSSTLLAAGAIQIISLAAAIILIGALIFMDSGNQLVSVLGAAVAAVSPILFTRYLDLRTEPIFLVFLLGSIALLLRFFQTGEDKWLWGAGILTAACGLFRYAGLAVLGSGMLTLLVLLRTAWLERIGKAIKFGFIPAIVIAALAFRNIMVSGSATNRVFSYHPPGLNVFRQAAGSIGEWILPSSVDPLFRLILLAAIVAGAASLIYFRKGGSMLLGLLSIYALVYSASLILSLTFFDASIRVRQSDARGLFTSTSLWAYSLFSEGPRLPRH